MAVWVAIAAPIYVIVVDLLIYCLDQRSLFWQRFFPNKRAPLLIAPRHTSSSSSISKTTLPRQFFAWDLIDPRGTATSHFAPRWCLIAWRIAALAFFTGGFFQLNSTDTLDGDWMTYYTNWNYVLLAITNIIGIVVVVVDMKQFPGVKDETQTNKTPRPSLPSAVDNANSADEITAQQSSIVNNRAHTTDSQRSTINNNDNNHLAAESQHQQNSNNNCSAVAATIAADGGSHSPSSWPLLRSIHLLCTEIQAPSLLFLSIFFWVTIFDGDTVVNELFVHTLNNIFPLIDVGVLSKTPFVSSHMLALMLYTTIYAVFMWIYGGITDNWPYDSMTFQPVAMIAYVFLPALLALAFLFYLGVVALRERIAAKKVDAGNRMSKEGGDSGGGNMAAAEVALVERV